MGIQRRRHCHRPAFLITTLLYLPWLQHGLNRPKRTVSRLLVFSPREGVADGYLEASPSPSPSPSNSKVVVIAGVVSSIGGLFVAIAGLALKSPDQFRWLWCGAKQKTTHVETNTTYGKNEQGDDIILLTMRKNSSWCCMWDRWRMFEYSMNGVMSRLK